LTLKHVSHHYFSKDSYTKALNDISISVQEGEFIALVGPSGCGKSTLLSIISGILEQTEGNVLLEGKSIHSSKTDIGYMLQQDYLFPWKTILENVLIGPKIKHRKTEDTKKRANELLAEVGLPNVAGAFPGSLSGGMRQRVALVRTLMTNPKILLVDEPFSALDYQTRLKLESIVSDLLRSYRKTAVLVTHDIGEAISMSDRIFLMNANPGSIANVFEVPIELRDEKPFYVRRHPKYQPLFDRVWEALNQTESPEEEKVVLNNHAT